MESDPQRTTSSFDRPEWTPAEPDRSWFDAPSRAPQAGSADLFTPRAGTAPGRDPQAGDQDRPTPGQAPPAGGQDWSGQGRAPQAGPQDWSSQDQGPQAGAQDWSGQEQGPPVDAQGWAAQGRSPRDGAQDWSGRTRDGAGATAWGSGDPEATGAWVPMAGGFRSAADEPPAGRWGAASEAPGWSPAPDARRGVGGGAEDRTEGARLQAGWSGDAGPQTGWGEGTGPQTGWGEATGWDQGVGSDRGREAGWGRDEPGDRAAAATAVGATRWDEKDGGKKHAVRHPVRLALFALVLFGLVAGSVAWMSMDKSVRLTVDGEARTVSTYASTVSGVLDDAGVTVSDHDTLAPAAGAKISDGGEIVLRRGRLITLTVDGKPRQVWVTATTVREALEQVGYRQDGLFVSANRSERLPLEGYQLTLRTPKSVTIVADGKKRRLVTTAQTVGEAMDEAGVRVDGDDRVSQLATALVRGGMTVTVTRVSTRTTTSQAEIEYKTVEKADPKAEVGSTTVRTKGVTGLQQVTRVQTYVDGKLTSTRVAKITVVREPVDEVVVVGPEPPEPPPTQPAGCADFPTTGGLNWCGLAKCESGLNPNAYNPAGPYYGLYQFDQQTWTANGGSGSPSGKSVAEQTAVAYSLYQARGASPWPVCGRNL